MKKLLPTHLFLFVISMLFTFNTSAQEIPDPGNDPLHTIDSTKQNHPTKLSSSKRAARNGIISKVDMDSILIVDRDASAKTDEQKAIPSIVTE
jgi:hypothetical protein